VALARGESKYTWADFNEYFVERVGAAEGRPDGLDRETAYYDQWTDALESMVLETGSVSKEELTARIEEFHDGERTAAEFVEGDRDDGHGHDHSHGRGHDHSHEGSNDHGHDSDHGH